MADKVVKTRSRVAKAIIPRAVLRHSKAGTEPAFTGKSEKTKDAGTYACVCCGQPLVQFRGEVRVRHRLAKLLQPLDESGGGESHRPDLWDGFERSALLTLQNAHLGTFLKMAPRHRAALLHEFGGAGFLKASRKTRSKNKRARSRACPCRFLQNARRPQLRLQPSAARPQFCFAGSADAGWPVPEHSCVRRRGPGTPALKNSSVFNANPAE